MVSELASTVHKVGLQIFMWLKTNVAQTIITALGKVRRFRRRS